MANPKNWQKSKMAPSSKSEKDDNKQKHQRKHKDHIIKLLTRGRVGRKRDVGPNVAFVA